MLAGMTASCVICPVEHIKGRRSLKLLKLDSAAESLIPSLCVHLHLCPLAAKLQMQTVGPKLYTGPIDAVKQVVRANGLPGLYRGFNATLLFRAWFGA